MKLDFFDCNAQIGRYSASVRESFFTAHELIDDLEPLGIRRAMVCHALSKELHPVEGNAAVIEETKGLPLVPCWTTLPHQTGEMPEPREFVEQMKTSGARAVKLYPTLHQYSFEDWCIGELLAELEREKIPLFLDAGQTNYHHIALTLAGHPDLRLTLMNSSYRSDRYLYPLMEKYHHLSVETSNYVVSGGIEALCSRFGPSRLVFGTGSPFTDPGAAVALMTYADIPVDQKQAIAGGNLERLLNWE